MEERKTTKRPKLALNPRTRPRRTQRKTRAASNGKEKKSKAHKKKEEEEDEEKIKRPSNPYIFFQNEKPDMAFKEIAAEIGNK